MFMYNNSFVIFKNQKILKTALIKLTTLESKNFKKSR